MQTIPGTRFVVSERQLRLLERNKVEFRCRPVDATRSGEQLNQDTFFWGTSKGVVKDYVLGVVDVFCAFAFAFAKFDTAKMLVTASDLLYASYRSTKRPGCRSCHPDR